MDKKRMAEIVDEFAGRNILVVGDTIIDHYVRGSVRRLNPEAPVPLLDAKKEEEMTGGAGNVAKNFATLGAHATLVSVVGDDPGAFRIKELADSEGYTFISVRDANRPTIRKARFLAGSQQLLRVDYEKTHDIEGVAEKELVENIIKGMQTAEGVLISDYAKGTVTEKVASVVLEEADKKNIPVVADMKASRVPYLRGVTAITPNRKEAHEFLGISDVNEQTLDPAELAQRLQENMGADVFVTLGADGVYVRTGDGIDELVPQEHKVEVFDVSGAGDTSATVVLLARLAGASPHETAELLNAAGAVVVSKVGSVGASQQEILDMMTHSHA